MLAKMKPCFASSLEHRVSKAKCTRHLDRVGFNIPLDIIQVILETIFPANHLTGAKTQSFQQITWLVLVNKIKQQPNYNTNNLNDTSNNY